MQATNALDGAGLIASPTPPQNPANGLLWLSSSLAHMQFDSQPSSRYPTNLIGQEISAWHTPGVGGNPGLHNLLFSGNGLTYVSCPDNVDFTQSFSGTASAAGTIVTVTSVNYGSLQVGMTINIGGNGTKITGLGTGTGGIGTYTCSTNFGSVSSQTLTANFWANGVNVVGGSGNAAGYTGGPAHSKLFIEGSTLYLYFPDNAGISTQGTISGTTLTVSSISSQSSPIVPGMTISGAGITYGATIQSQLSGTTGGIGTYRISASFTVSSPESISIGAQNIRVATANIATPTQFTLQPNIIFIPTLGGTNNGAFAGSSFVYKDGSTYYLIQDFSYFQSFPGEGGTYSWQDIVATSNSPLGPFTLVVPLITSTMAGPNSSPGGYRTAVKENGVWVTFLHTCTWGRCGFPTDIYRATSPSLGTDTWQLTDGGGPIMRRAHQFEVDQVADACVYQPPGGVTYMFYTGADNRGGSGFQLMVTILYPALMQYDGLSQSWKPASPGYSGDLPLKNPLINWGTQNTAWQSPSGFPGSAAGTWGTEVVSGAPGGVARYNSSNAQNDSVQWDVVLAPGTYNLDVFYQKSAAGAINTITMDNGGGGFFINIGTVDTYASGTDNTGHSTMAFTIYGSDTYRRRMRFQAATRNASSSGWTLADFGWAITKTDI